MSSQEGRSGDMELLLRVLDLNITVNRDTFEDASRAMGLSYNTLRYEKILLLPSAAPSEIFTLRLRNFRMPQ